MSTLGANPSFTGYEYAGTNTENQVGAGLYTFPVNALITDVVFYASGYEASSTTFYGIAWGSAGQVLAGGSAVTLGAGDLGVGAQAYRDSGGLNLAVSAGTEARPGFWRSPGGGAVWSTGTGTGYYGSNSAGSPTTFSATSMGSNTLPAAYFVYTEISPPSVVTQAATNITATSAVLNGTVNPNGASTWGDYAWGPTSSLGSYLGGSSSAAETTIGAGSSPVSMPLTLTGLTPDTTYYFAIRANQTSDSNPEQGSTLSFTTLATAPYAPNSLSPASGAIDLTIAETLSWSEFQSPIEGDEQASFTYRWAPQGSSPSWTTATVDTAANSVNVAANTFAAGGVQWQVQVTGTSGYTSAWSALAYFTAGSPPAAPTIDVPIANQTIPTNPYTVVWEPPDGQTDYEVRTVADDDASPDPATIYQDTGDVVGTGGSQSMPFVTNNQAEHVQVAVEVGGLWSPYADVLVTVGYSAPGVATLTLTPDDSTASISVAISNPSADGDVTATVSNDLYRYRSDQGSSTSIRIATGLDPDATYIDYTPASGYDYEYQSVAFDSYGNSTLSGWQD